MTSVHGKVSALTLDDFCAWERDGQGRGLALGECPFRMAASFKQKTELATRGQTQKPGLLHKSHNLGAVFTDQVMSHLCLKSSSGFFS